MFRIIVLCLLLSQSVSDGLLQPEIVIPDEKVICTLGESMEITCQEKMMYYYIDHNHLNGVSIVTDNHFSVNYYNRTGSIIYTQNFTIPMFDINVHLTKVVNYVMSNTPYSAIIRSSMFSIVLIKPGTTFLRLSYYKEMPTSDQIMVGTYTAMIVYYSYMNGDAVSNEFRLCYTDVPGHSYDKVDCKKITITNTISDDLATYMLYLNSNRCSGTLCTLMSWTTLEGKYSIMNCTKRGYCKEIFEITLSPKLDDLNMKHMFKVYDWYFPTCTDEELCTRYLTSNELTTGIFYKDIIKNYEITFKGVKVEYVKVGMINGIDTYFQNIYNEKFRSSLFTRLNTLLGYNLRRVNNDLSRIYSLVIDNMVFYRIAYEGFIRCTMYVDKLGGMYFRDFEFISYDDDNLFIHPYDSEMKSVECFEQSLVGTKKTCIDTRKNEYVCDTDIFVNSTIYNKEYPVCLNLRRKCADKSSYGLHWCFSLLNYIRVFSSPDGEIYLFTYYNSDEVSFSVEKLGSSEEFTYYCDMSNVKCHVEDRVMRCAPNDDISHFVQNTEYLSALYTMITRPSKSPYCKLTKED